MQSILFTASTYSHIINFHMPYIKAFKNMGFVVHVACGGRHMNIDYADRVIHIPFEKSITSPKNFGAVRKIRKLIKDNNYKIISCHTSLAAFFTRLAVMGMKNRPIVVCTAHGYLFSDEYGKIKNIMLENAERLVSPVTDLLMTMNEWDTQFALKNKLGKSIKEIYGMGLDSSKLRTYTDNEINELKTKLNISKESFVMVYAAEFSKRKSQSVIIKALTLLPENVVLILAGDGDLYNYCVDYSKELNVYDKIRFVGHISDMPLYYSASDIAVTASKSEGIPFNIMEAMYYNLPSIASNVKGHTDLLKSSNAGLLYEYGDFESLADCVKTLMNDEALRQKLSQNAKNAIKPYMLENVMPDILQEYKKIYKELKTELAKEGAKR